MARYKRFTFLCDSNERQVLAALAKSLKRSQSDSVRWLIQEAAYELKIVQPGVEAMREPAPGGEVQYAPAQ